MSLRARLGLVCLVAIPHIALANPVAPPAPADQPVKKALILGVDGLRADLLRLGRAPAVQRLMDEGGYTEEMRTGPVTVSGPGWSNALCGVWMDKHGCKDNKFEGVDYGRYPHLFLRARQRLPEAKLCHYIGWAPIDEQILGEGRRTRGGATLGMRRGIALRPNKPSRRSKRGAWTSGSCTSTTSTTWATRMASTPRCPSTSRNGR